MASPVITNRVTPTGYKMPDGYRSLITWAKKPNIQFWEREVKPPGIDGKEAIDTTTMHNITWRTYAARHLKTLTESSFMAALDPDVMNDIWSLVNNEDSVTMTYPSNDQMAFFGFLQKVDFENFKEGEFPGITVTLTPTNWDPVGFVEAAPVFQSAAGT
jgi:hypothetical protein